MGPFVPSSNPLPTRAALGAPFLPLPGNRDSDGARRSKSEPLAESGPGDHHGSY